MLPGVGKPREERSQVATDDLRRWPPERLEADRGRPAAPAAGLMPEVAGRPACEQHAAQDGPEGRGLANRSQVGGDRLGRSIGLLRRDAALLNRKVRHIAGRKDVSEADHAALLVDDDEPVAGVRNPVDLLPVEIRERDDPVGGDGRFWNEVQLVVFGLSRVRMRVERDAALGEERLAAALAFLPKSQRLLLGRHERDLDVVDVPRTGVVCESNASSYRQRPDSAQRDGDRDASHDAGVELSKEPTDQFGSAGSRNVSAPSTAGLGLAPVARRSTS